MRGCVVQSREEDAFSFANRAFRESDPSDGSTRFLPVFTIPFVSPRFLYRLVRLEAPPNGGRTLWGRLFFSFEKSSSYKIYKKYFYLNENTLLIKNWIKVSVIFLRHSVTPTSHIHIFIHIFCSFFSHWLAINDTSSFLFFFFTRLRLSKRKKCLSISANILLDLFSFRFQLISHIVIDNLSDQLHFEVIKLIFIFKRL